MLNQALGKKLLRYQHENLIRERKILQRNETAQVMVQQRLVHNFCSNDYLGLTFHPKIKKAFIDGISEYGVGSGASALVSGYSFAHKVAEEKFAEFMQRERALLFGSGYLANISCISALTDHATRILADKFCHASIIDGIRLSSGKYTRYHHGDMQHLATLLAEQESALVISETVFSMGGDIAALDKITQLAKKHSAYTLIDDAHGVGVLGKHGRGAIEHFDLASEDVTCLVTPLGKAFGAQGAMVSGSNDLIEALLQFSRSYCYSTALPPAMAVAITQAIKVIQTESWRIEKLRKLTRYFCQALQQRELTCVSDDLTPIKSIIIGDNHTVMELQQVLLNAGFFVGAIRPPSVPMHSARIRITLNCHHETTQIDELLDHVAYFLRGKVLCSST